MTFQSFWKDPKGTARRVRQSKRRRLLKDAATDRDTKVLTRFHGRCIAYGIVPRCLKVATDPHELIPRSKGGALESWNRVPVCRLCHGEAQGRVGGNRLEFTWPHKASGALPNADLPGHVTAIWRPSRSRRSS